MRRYFFTDDKSWEKQELANSSGRLDVGSLYTGGTTVSPEHEDFRTDWYRDDARKWYRRSRNAQGSS
ncbi:unnamed protein product [Auanema sp. JU1783]|nr:unnamed protein product [Auanema sp. JU1783]